MILLPTISLTSQLMILSSYLACLVFLLWPNASWQQRLTVRLCAYVLFYGFLLLLYWRGYLSSAGLCISAALPPALHLRKWRNLPLRTAAEVLCLGIPLLSALWPALGFRSILQWGPAALYETGKLYSLTLSLPKMLLVLAMACALPLYQRLRIHSPSLLAALVLAAGLVLLANTAGIPWVFKSGGFLPWFLLINLSVTVLAEEMYFRLLLQDTLTRWLRGPYARWFAALISGLLFYLVHGFLLPDTTVAWLYLTAALTYAAFYAYFRNLLASVVLHYAVNVLHILLLHYPL